MGVSPAIVSGRRHSPVAPRFRLHVWFLAVLPLAATKLLGTLAVATRYGYQRDELYYLACARHLAWGYVDFPAVTPVLAHLNGLVFGASLVGLRVLPTLCGVFAILMAAAIARAWGAAPQARDRRRRPP